MAKMWLRIYVNGKLKISLVNSNHLYTCLLPAGSEVDLISNQDFEEFSVQEAAVYSMGLTKEGAISVTNLSKEK